MAGRSDSPIPNRARIAGAASGASTGSAPCRDPGRERRSRNPRRVRDSIPRARATLHGMRPRRREDRLDGRPVDLEVRGQDEHVGRRQVPVGIEEGEQPVVQDLRLAHRGVADVDPERVFGRTGYRFRSLPRGRRGGRPGVRHPGVRHPFARRAGDVAHPTAPPRPPDGDRECRAAPRRAGRCRRAARSDPPTARP